VALIVLQWLVLLFLYRRRLALRKKHLAN